MQEIETVCTRDNTTIGANAASYTNCTGVIPINNHSSIAEGSGNEAAQVS